MPEALVGIVGGSCGLAAPKYVPGKGAGIPVFRKVLGFREVEGVRGEEWGSAKTGA